MGEFIDADRAARALEASPDEAEQAYVSPELGANFFQVLGNVATQWVNSKVPGLGPAINPGYYKDLAKQQALQRQPQQTAQAAGGAPIAQAKPGLPSWVLPASIAGGAAILAIILAVSLGGRRRNPEGKTRFRRRRRFSRKSLRRSGLRRRAIRRNASFKTAAELARSFGKGGYYVDEDGRVGMAEGSRISWFGWDPQRQEYTRDGNTGLVDGIEFRRIAEEGV